MEEQITVDQHYVPRFYMKNFSVVRPNKKAFISFYKFDGEIYRNDIPTKSICYEDYFYGEDGVLEKELSVKEDRWARTIHGIVACPEKELQLSQIYDLKEFGVYQFLRTVATLNHSKSSISSLFTTHFMNQYADLSKEVVEEIVNQKVDRETQASMLVEMCDDLVKESDDLEVGIVKYIRPVLIS